MIFAVFFSLQAADRALLVHNSLKDIEACQGKLKLKLVRTWGGEDEKDENKFFKTPTSVILDKNGLVYICDIHKHCVKVFKHSGEYVRTIGRRGKGPGDVFAPTSIALSPGGDLVVYELGGRRIQWFSPEGKSKKIQKETKLINSFGMTANNELAVFIREKAHKTKKLISILDGNGNPVRGIGTYHDMSVNYEQAETIEFTMDDNDNLYAANRGTPVIRKYSPDGRMVMAITYEPPLKIPPVEITLNNHGDEIKIKRSDDREEPMKIIKKGRTIRLERKSRVLVCQAIGVDSNENIYSLTIRRPVTKEERKACFAPFSLDRVIRKFINFDVIDKIKDLNQLLVFNPEGKIIAQSLLPNIGDTIHIKGNRLFVVDWAYHQRVLEYEMTIEDEGRNEG
jgi:hypothetical protein